MPSLVTEPEYLILVAGALGSIIYGVVAWIFKK
jgi:hypothetical protein